MCMDYFNRFDLWERDCVVCHCCCCQHSFVNLWTPSDKVWIESFHEVINYICTCFEISVDNVGIGRGYANHLPD